MEIDQAKADPAWAAYTYIRELILKMLNEAALAGGYPSQYWQEELAGFDYMLDASPLVIRRLREHCHHITGLRPLEYRQHHHHLAAKYKRKLAMLLQLEPDLFVPESTALGGFGFRSADRLFNLDTLKCFEALIALRRATILDPLLHRSLSPSDRPVVLELGAGWGGLAFQFHSLCPNSTYLIVDLPQTLLFSATYLLSQFPKAKSFVYDAEGAVPSSREMLTYNFLFLPHYLFLGANLPRIDLAINTVSFQEMTTAQVSGYITNLAERGCPYIYSLNMDRSPHNPELSGVEAILGTGYEVREVHVLRHPYVWLPSDRGIRSRAIELVRSVDHRLRKDRQPYQYRHLVGSL